MEKTIVTFGEIMGRMDMPHQMKYIQNLPGMIRYSFAGSEANVAVSNAYMGQKARFVTALPKNQIGDACVNQLRGIGVDTQYIVRRPGRLGLYYVESGANQRPSQVIYDREYSAISLAAIDEFDMDCIFADAGWFHVSGITPALSRQSADNTIAFCAEAQKRGITVSCDLNFRKKLWNWNSPLSAKDLAGQVMPDVLNYVDVLIANEEDSADILDIHADSTDINQGQIAHEGYVSVAKEIMKRFPKIKTVATTLRESISASHNNWGAMLYDREGGKAFFAPNGPDGSYQPYQIRNIVDRVGGGDSFAAGLIYALTSSEYSDPQKALQFAAAASCLCHSINGDYNFSLLGEVELLMKGDASGRVQR